MPEENIDEEVIDEKPTDEKPAEEKPAEKPAEEKPAEEKPAEKPAAEKPVVPEKYDLKLSEGSMLSAEDLERISSHAREKGLTQEQAAERLSVEEASAKKGAEAYEKRQEEVLAAEKQRWIDAGMADAEIGGDKYQESAELAKRVVEKFGTKELREGLDKSGLGNYHEFVKLMSRIGRAMDSDKLIIGDNNNKEPKDIAERMYSGEKKE
jgi:hypothetical protein